MWVIYPPTTHNLSSLSRYYSDSDSLFEDSFPTFQGGVLFLQRDSQRVYIPPNCLHFVFTLSSCILCGCEITPHSVLPCRIKSFCASIASSRSSSVDKLHGFLRHFVSGLDRGSTGGQTFHCLSFGCLDPGSGFHRGGVHYRWKGYVGQSRKCLATISSSFFPCILSCMWEG